MKKYVILSVLFVLSCSVFSQAQTLKFGHINVQELVDLMPERDSAYVTFQKHQDDLEETYVSIQNELQAKVAEYQQKSATWSQVILEAKTRDIQGINQRLQEFEQSAQESMAQTQNILFAPVYAKANEAIQKVGKDMGLIYVFNSSGMPYIDESQSINLLDKVKEELKIPASKVAPTPVAGQTPR